MSCCSGNCGCGDGCKCGTSCQGCKMYPNVSYSESTTTETLITGVRPKMKYFDEGVGAENGGCNCKCGDNCTCSPCTCK